MAALWGGGAGHAGAGGTLPLRGGSEAAVGSGLGSTQYLLAEDIHLASLEAESILEAGEFLETMQDYLDSSVISIIEDFSTLNEAMGCTEAENELSLLTAITDILDSADDESLSPFDTIPDSELLTSPRRRENSSFQRFIGLSVTSPEKDLHTKEDFQEPKLCSIMTEKVEVSTANLPLAMTPRSQRDTPASKKSSGKAPRGEWRLFRHRERDLSVLQRSDGEEEEEEEATAGCRQELLTGLKDIPGPLAAKEAEKGHDESDGPCVIAPESISLSELVRSMHPYCLPTFTVCMSPDSRPLAEELLAGPIILEIVPEGGESVEIPVVLQNVETVENSHKTDSNYVPGLEDKEASLLVPVLENASPEDNTKIIGLDTPTSLDEQAEEVSRAASPRAENSHPQIKEEVPRSADDQKHGFELGQVAPKNINLTPSEKGQICGHSKKKRKKAINGEMWQKEAISSLHSSACTEEQTRTNADSLLKNDDFPEEQLKKAEGQGEGELLPNHGCQAVNGLDSQAEELSTNKAEPQNSVAAGLEDKEALPGLNGQSCTYCDEDADPAVTGQGDTQRGPSEGSPTNLTASEVGSPEASQLFSSSCMDVSGQSPQSLSCPNSEEAKEALAKDTRPKPLSLTEYRQRRQQRQSIDGTTRGVAENQSASKWPTLPELPTELADLPCFTVPPPPIKDAPSGVVKESEKSAGSSTTPPPSGKACAPSPSMPASISMPAPKPPPPPQPGCVTTAASTASLPALPSLPSQVGAFPPIGMHVPPPPPPLPPPLPPYLPPGPGPFLPPSPDPYILSSQPPPVPSWSPFPSLPPNYQSFLPLATETCPPVFHAVPPVPAPTWPPPPLPLPPFPPSLPYNSAEWTLAPQPPYWNGIPVPPPVLPISYGDQGALIRTPPVGTLASPASDGAVSQPNLALMPEPSSLGEPSLAAKEKPGLPTQLSPGPLPATVKTASRRVSDPRRQAQSLAADSKAEMIASGFQPLAKVPRPQSVVEPSEHVGKKAIPQESCSVSLPQQPPGMQKPPSLPAPLPVADALPPSGPKEKTLTVRAASAAAQSGKEAPPSPELQKEEDSSLSAASVQEKLMVVTGADIKEAAQPAPISPGFSESQKVHVPDLILKKPTNMWKHQPLISIAQRNRHKDIVQAFINEIGIEASDLSSLLEQFEKTEAKKETPSVGKSQENVPTGNDNPKVHQEKKMIDRLQAPELINVAGLTPPATPPHQLWKPLAAVSLLRKAGSPKGARLLKSLGKPHRKGLAPAHVGSGEHDYCQVSAAQPKECARWNVKQNLEITVKPIKSVAKQTLEQAATNQPPAPSRLDLADTLSIACQTPKEAPSRADAGEVQVKASGLVLADVSPVVLKEAQQESSCKSSCKEPLDHRTSTPRSMAGSSNESCSVLLSPAASPCRDAEEPSLQQPQEAQQKRLASKRSLRCYRSRQKSVSPANNRWRGRSNRTSRSCSSSSDGDSDSSSSSSSFSSSSRSRSPPSKRWRRCHSRSSSSSSSGSSWSRSRSRSRSRSSSCSSSFSRSSSRSSSVHRRRGRRKRCDSSSSCERYLRQKIRYKERAIEERRIVFIGKIPSRMTRSELRHRFSIFGDIEDCTLHFREHGDNYGFVTYRYAEEAFAAIERGHTLRRPDEQPFDLCFGGRRQFCKRNYVDLDSNRDDFEPAPVKNKFDALDFDTLLKQAQRSLQR